MQKRKSKAPYIAVVFGGLVVVLAVGIGIWLNKTDVIINASIASAPIRKIPNPNAYDYYTDAADKVVMNTDIENALISTGPRKSLPASSKTYTLNQKKAIIKANNPALQAVREGLKHECLTRLDDSPVMYGQSLKLLDLSRLLSLETQVYTESAEYGKAMQSCLDNTQLGSDLLRGSGIYGLGLSSATNNISNTDLIDNLSSAETQSAIIKLKKIIAKYSPYHEILQVEKQYGIQKMKSLTYYRFQETRALRASFVTKPLGRIMLPGYIADMDKAIKNSSVPYAQYVKSPSNSSGILLRGYSQNEIQMRCMYERTVCKNNMLMLQLALHAYKTVNGKYPSGLTDLKPKYLKQIPQDHFAANGTYNYHLTPKGYILYSVGPDGIDNGGQDKTWITHNPMDRIGDITVEHTK